MKERGGGKKILVEIPKLKYLKTFIISENKILRFLQKDEKYYIEIIGKGYIVQYLAGKTLIMAEKRYKDVIKKINAGWSSLEPFWF
ncbi:hypothetical protein [Candidatus Borrarchaeum sp.]|uniref:hypothetical protein n=1 Tax=Candidatus Borrarchaeum sp. TaxID=2846742 RepID=UPI00257D9C3D|nr:hypothetical protein [Candidatus Borrarchaeum sp.]